MFVVFVFFLGLICALLGVIPPGLLNMTAAKISLKEGRTRGIMFCIGVCVVVFAQTYIATMFARYLSNNKDVVTVLQRVALALFVLITIYFLFIAKSEPKAQEVPQIRSKHSRFFQGVLLSSLNVFPIPYQAYLTITFASFGWLNFSQINILLYVLGASIGTFIMLYIYVIFFNKIKGKRLTSQKNMNLIIGSITGIIALVTFFKIVKNL